MKWLVSYSFINVGLWSFWGRDELCIGREMILQGKSAIFNFLDERDMGSGRDFG